MTGPQRFAAASRWLHWSMAAMIVPMLFIGIGMAATVSRRYEILVSIHRPLGIAIFLLALVRLVNRWVNPPPPLPPSVPTPQRIAAVGSHYLLYSLMLILPLVGWAMLSAAPYPIVVWGGLRLPSIVPQDPLTYAGLRRLHTALALLFFATIVLHFGAALFHALIRRDGVFESMASWRRAKSGQLRDEDAY
jgi:cytochrome b561